MFVQINFGSYIIIPTNCCQVSHLLFGRLYSKWGEWVGTIGRRPVSSPSGRPTLELEVMKGTTYIERSWNVDPKGL